MNVAFLIPTLNNGGAERVVSHLSRGLSEEFKITMILYDGSKIDYSYQGKLYDLKSITSANPISKLTAFIKRIREVGRIKEENNIDVTVSFLGNSNLVNIFSRKDDRVVISERCYRFKRWKIHSILYSLLIKYFYNKADTIIAVSKLIKWNLIENFAVKKGKIEVIYNPFDKGYIDSMLSQETDIEDDIFQYPLIVTMGRMTHQKGQWYLIRAFKRVKEELGNAKLLILGKGEMEAELKNLVKELGLEEDVLFLGFQKNPFSIMNRAKLFVSSSLCEGFSNVIIEAMACGIPVISTDCKSGPREILAPESDPRKHTNELEYASFGVLTAVFDGQVYDSKKPLTDKEISLADGIINLLRDKQLYKRYSKAAQERVRDLEISKISKQWKDLIRNMN